MAITKTRKTETINPALPMHFCMFCKSLAYNNRHVCSECRRLVLDDLTQGVDWQDHEERLDEVEDALDKMDLDGLERGMEKLDSRIEELEEGDERRDVVSEEDLEKALEEKADDSELDELRDEVKELREQVEQWCSQRDRDAWVPETDETSVAVKGGGWLASLFGGGR